MSGVWLTDEQLEEAERRARRFSGAYHGTSGTLAAYVIHLIGMVRHYQEADNVKERRRGPLIIGLAGAIGAGKTLAASMIPGAHHLQWADPIYRGLAAMFGVPEEVLRDRTQKERGVLAGDLEVVPRHCLRTLGTEWGRDMIHPDIWVRLTMQRIDTLAETIGVQVFAICGTRFPNEVQAIRDRGGEVWWVDRFARQEGDHVSDRLIGPHDCDRVIKNYGRPDDLRKEVEAAFMLAVFGVAAGS
jgi:hypothetical protein